ncbi:Peptidoglycan-synthase activator LpoB [Dyadobacter soli]|uniref:Peptidoglycan-synthase activator LpoB n=1 Tax=Dyadobacter soli TaxID=659014 RepID=A0A1G7GMH3_9BACT|nr:hypothetical protein [Dyadobacter soli]SDE89291.1 Peptidoglycan-synthase activator LpoB [Dyadobacter soli]
MKKILKNILTAITLGIAFTSSSLGNAELPTDPKDKVKVAVVEFTPAPDITVMTYEAKRQLQASIAFELHKTQKFHVVDVRHTRDASQANLAVINGESTAAAVKVGKQLGVSYVLTGTVVEYNTQGSATLATRLVEVSTGKVTHSTSTSQEAISKVTVGGAEEMAAKVLKPLIKKLTASLAGLAL